MAAPALYCPSASYRCSTRCVGSVTRCAALPSPKFQTTPDTPGMRLNAKATCSIRAGWSLLTTIAASVSATATVAESSVIGPCSRVTVALTV